MKQEIKRWAYDSTVRLSLGEKIQVLMSEGYRIVTCVALDYSYQTGYILSALIIVEK